MRIKSVYILGACVVTVILLAIGVGTMALSKDRQSFPNALPSGETISVTPTTASTAQSANTPDSTLSISTKAPTSSPFVGYVYFSHDRAIWKLDVSTGHETLLLDRFIKQGMAASPDGKWLAYVVLEEIHPDSPRSIWVVNTHTGQETKASSIVPRAKLFWLPDNRLMVIEYLDQQTSSDGDILGWGEIRHTVFDPSSKQSSPAPWYIPPPDIGEVVYAPTFDCAAEIAYDYTGDDRLRVFCVDASEPITVATSSSLGDVLWSVDGKLLAFDTGITYGTLHIWQRETGVFREINLDAESSTGLSWSPDGQWMAFRDGRDECVLHLQDEAVTCFPGTASSYPVAWLPDSQHIVFATCAPQFCEQTGCDCSNPSLVTMSIPDGEIVELATGVESNIGPVWGK